MKQLFVLLLTLNLFNSASSQLQVSHTAGRPMNALTFDGIDDKLVLEPAKSLNLSSGTIECWVRNQSGKKEVEFLKLFIPEKVFTIYLNHSTEPSVLMGERNITIKFSSNNWNHIAIVNGEQKSLLYMNGRQVAELPLSFDFANVLSIRIGGEEGRSFKGSIDELRIWHQERNEEQLLRNRDAILAGNESGLLAQYSFDEIVSRSIVPDRTGNGHDGHLLHFYFEEQFSGLMARPLINLPVNPNYFVAGKDLNVVKLFWNTVMEFNTREYVVEKSSNGKDFTGIARVAAETKQIAQRRYGFVDVVPDAGISYYRLKIINNDEGYSYSEVRKVQ
ncbi:MAG: LamG domain-containing protein [Flavitalea sp.]